MPCTSLRSVLLHSTNLGLGSTYIYIYLISVIVSDFNKNHILKHHYPHCLFFSMFSFFLSLMFLLVELVSFVLS